MTTSPAHLPFVKPARTPEDLLQKLKHNGLVVPDDAQALAYLRGVGAYRLKGYWHHVIDPTTKQFPTGYGFENIRQRCELDREVRAATIEAIDRLEVAVRSVMANHLSLAHSPHWFLDHRIFKPTGNWGIGALIRKVEDEVGRAKGKPFIKHYFDRHDDPYLPPSWAISECVSFAMWSRTYASARSPTVTFDNENKSTPIWCCASSKRVIAQSLQAHCIGAANADKESLHIGAVAFIHRFGSSLNEHVHFHVCVVDGVFEEVAGEGSADAAMQVSASGVVFHPATGIDATPVAQVQTTLQKRILRAFVARGLLENCDAKDMLGYKHSGFSVDAGVCIEAHDRAALERLLRYCARPPFSMERLRKEGSKLVYRCAKQRSEPTSDKRGAKADELHLTPLELIDRIAALVPPPRTHRHRYFGVLAPNSPLRAAVTALATPAQAAPVLGASISTGECAPGVVPMSSALPSQSEPVLPKRAAHYLWAVLIARIYEVFPLLCPLCGGHMRIIAFITHSADIRHILDHIGADSEPPRISPARGPPLWDDCSDAQMDDGAQTEPADWDLAAQPAPDFEVDQRISW